jgi:hypothetical protein
LTAAAAKGAQAVFPSFPADAAGTDWNDLAQAVGRPSAAGQLRQAIAIGDREQAAQGLAAARDELAQDQDCGLFRSVGHVIGKIAKAFSRDRGRTPAAELKHDQGR